MRPRVVGVLVAANARAFAAPALAAPRALAALEGRPDAVVDLRTRERADLVKGQWRYSDTRIVEVDFNAPGPDLRPSGQPIKTCDYAPHVGARDFDDAAWAALDAATLYVTASSAVYRIALTTRGLGF